jgi:pimeloyl-ACP methyl ester carboxylesterase
MGGFGALAIAFEHPDVFGLVYAASPCCMAFVGRLAPSGPAWPALAAVSDWRTAPDRIRTVLGMVAALDGSKSSPRLFTELPFRTQDGTVVRNQAAYSRWLARMPPDLAAAMVRRRDRAPEISLEAGSQEAEILEGIRLLRLRLDSLRIAYSDTTFVGGHIDRVRDRFAHQILPIVGHWFDSAKGAKRNP